MLKVLDHLEEMADLVPHGRGDADHLRRGHAPLRERRADPGRAGLDARPQLRLGAGAVHHHVRVDGEVRRRLRRAHRHPRRRRRADQPAERAHSREVHRLRPARRRRCSPPSSARWERPSSGRTARTRRSSSCSASHRRPSRRPTTPDLEMPTWIVYSAVPLGSYLMCFRFLQVTWGFRSHRRAAAPRPEQGRGHRGRSPAGRRRRRQDLPHGGRPAPARDGEAASHEHLPHLRAAGRADAHRHADLDLARPHRPLVPVHR